MYVLFIIKVINLFLLLLLLHESIKLVKKKQVVLYILQLLVKQVFRFEQSCNHKNTHNLTVDNQHGSEDKDQCPDLKLSTQLTKKSSTVVEETLRMTVKQLSEIELC